MIKPLHMTILFVVTIGVVAAFVGMLLFRPSGLEKIHRSIERSYSTVEHISPAQLAQSPSDEFVLFDVRELDEYAVSHLDGAIRVDPDIDVETFIAEHREALAGKTPVFYCSVGRRSSALLSRLDTVLKSADVKGAYNLEGGAFRWSNENRLFIKDGVETEMIHPYNLFWGRYLKNKHAIQYAPEKSADVDANK